MAIIVDTETNQGGVPVKRYASLTNGNYTVVVTGFNPDLSTQFAGLTGDGNDTLIVSLYAEVYGAIDLKGGNDVLRMSNGGGDTPGGTVYGGDGDDYVSGYNILRLYGGSGNDTLMGGRDVYGDDGDDIISARYDAWGGAGNDNVGVEKGVAYGDDGDDVVSSLYKAYGGAGNDTVATDYGAAFGDSGNDVVSSERGDAYGGTGDDIVTAFWSAYGDDGDDTLRVINAEEGWLYGGAGNDRLFGSTGNDRLFGGSGVDLLVGGSGKDVMTGGAGADVFQFGKGDLGLSYSTRDEITDFMVGEDKIDLTAYAGARISFDYSGKNDRIKIDVDGDRRTDFMIEVNVFGDGSLTMNDIMI